MFKHYVWLLTYDLYDYCVKASGEVRSSHHPQHAVSDQTLRRTQLSRVKDQIMFECEPKKFLGTASKLCYVVLVDKTIVIRAYTKL